MHTMPSMIGILCVYTHHTYGELSTELHFTGRYVCIMNEAIQSLIVGGEMQN